MHPPFVDCHSHVCPSGDDGAATVAQGALLCAEAARRGTGILFATPHVWPTLPLTAERERRVRAAFAELSERAPLELRLGFELTPSAELLRADLRRYELEGTEPSADGGAVRRRRRDRDLARPSAPKRPGSCR